MSLAETIAKHQRLTILRLLAAAADYRLNDSLIHGALGDFGLGATRDAVRGHLAWLEENGLLTVMPTPAKGEIAVLTDRGLDVAEGRTVHPGVQRPSPSSIASNMLRAAIGLKPEE